MKKNWKRFAGVLAGTYLRMVFLVAQAPTGIDTRAKDPNPFTLDDILLYIVFPVILFATAYLVHRRQKKQAKQKGPANE
jgi:hypothetical protein